MFDSNIISKGNNRYDHYFLLKKYFGKNGNKIKNNNSLTRVFYFDIGTKIELYIYIYIYIYL